MMKKFSNKLSFFIIGILLLAVLYLSQEISIRPDEVRAQIDDDISLKLFGIKTGDEKVDREIDKIVEHIKSSLEDKEGSFWFDDWHLKPELSNIKVFNEQRSAVKRMLLNLGECREKSRIEFPQETKQVFREIINNLVQADKLLAQTIIEDAKVTDIRNPKFEKVVKHLISKAEQEYEKGLKELVRPPCEKHLFGGYSQEKAITRFSKGWLFALEAIKSAKGEFGKQISFISIKYTAGVSSFLSNGIFSLINNPISPLNLQGNIGATLISDIFTKIKQFALELKTVISKIISLVLSFKKEPEIVPSLPTTPSPAVKTSPKVVLVGSYNFYYKGNEVIYVYDKYAFGGGKVGVIEIIDISNPASPVQIGKYPVKFAGRRPTGVWEAVEDIYVSGNYLYAAVTSGLEIVDISDPKQPKLVKHYNNGGSFYKNIRY